ncbi:MAG: hypothetical protein ACRD1O_07710, partial [Terriglobia bacterium]
FSQKGVDHMMKKRVMVLLLLLGIVSVAPVFAGSAAIGTVAGSLNASVSGQALLPNSTVFNGDQLQVKDGAAVIALANGSRLTLGSETQVQFFKQADGVAVSLAKGNVSMYHPAKGSDLAVNVQSWSITPDQGYKSVGEVAMLNDAVIVTAKEGALHVQGNGRSINVAQGKTITLVPKTAAMPNSSGTQKLVSGGSSGLWVAAISADVVGGILGGLALSNAGETRSSANFDNAVLQSATSAANAATSTANAAGCAINAASPSLTPSPYIPPAGMTCP